MKYLLDYSAILHSALMNEKYLNSFRFDANFEEEIDPIVLQNALNSIVSKYPTICCKICKDFFWYYVESLDELKIRKSTLGSFTEMNDQSVYEQAICVMYNEKKISLEVFHAVSDGQGAFQFFKDLITKYILLKYKEELVHKNIQCKKMEIDDAFIQFKGKPEKNHKSTKSRKLFKFSKKKKVKNLKISTYILDLNKVKEASKKYNCSINELILASFFKAISKVNTYNQKICLLSPINLRNIFSSNTLRNFTLCASIEAYGKEREDELIILIKEQMKKQKSIQYQSHEVYKLQKLYQSIFVRYCPLAVKKRLIRMVYALMGETSCMTVSNLGKIEMDEKINKYIKSFDVILSPRLSTPNNCGIITYGDEIHVNLTHDDKQNVFLEALMNEFQKWNKEN